MSPEHNDGGNLDHRQSRTLPPLRSEVTGPAWPQEAISSTRGFDNGKNNRK